MLMGRSYQYHNYNVSPLFKDFNNFYGIAFVSKFPNLKCVNQLFEEIIFHYPLRVKFVVHKLKSWF